MKNNTFVVSAMVAAALLGIVSMFHVQRADASPRNPMLIADAGMDMKGMNMEGMNKEAKPITHRGIGTVKMIDAAKGMVTLAHDPIASLNWPAMTMSYRLQDASLARGIKVGDVVHFEFVQSGADYVVTRLQPTGK